MVQLIKLRSALRYAVAIVGVMVLATGMAYWFRNKAEELVVASAAHGQIFQIAAALERFYGVKIILSPDVDSTNTYSGVLKKKDNIESVLNSLRNSIPFNYKKWMITIYLSHQKRNNF